MKLPTVTGALFPSSATRMVPFEVSMTATSSPEGT